MTIHRVKGKKTRVKGKKTAHLTAREIPGTVKRGNALYYLVGGEYYEVKSVINHEEYGLVPVLDMEITDMPRKHKKEE